MVEKVKILMNETKARPVDIAKYLGVGTNTFSNWFNRENIPAKYAPLLAFYFTKLLNRRITEGWLLAEDNKFKISEVAVVPIVGTASCGALESTVFEEEGTFANFNAKFWKSSLYCVIANGDSMSPEIDDGDEVIIDAEAKPKNGDLALYKIDDEIAIKVFFEDKEAYMIQFIPYNTNDAFKIKTFRMDDEITMSRLSVHKVVGVNKVKTNNRAARLKMIGR